MSIDGFTEMIPEIFNKIEAVNTKKEKKEILEQYKNVPTLQHILRGAYDPKVQWSITEQPDFTPNDAPVGLNENNLYIEIPRCSLFVKGHPAAKGVKPERLKQILIQILESMHPSESFVYMEMLKKKLKVKGLTSKLVLEVWPNLYKEKGA
jgi:hypothetical protein